MDKAKIARSGSPFCCLSKTARRSPSLDPRRAVTFNHDEQRTTHRRAGGSLRIGARGCDASSLARCKTGRLTMGGLGCFTCGYLNLGGYDLTLGRASVRPSFRAIAGGWGALLAPAFQHRRQSHFQCLSERPKRHFRHSVVCASTRRPEFFADEQKPFAAGVQID